MGKNKRTITSGIAGTLAMTLFSHLVSKWQKDVFQEQKLLNILLSRIIPYHRAKFSGWFLHLLVGVGFSYLDFRVLKRREKKSTPGRGLLFGAIDGIIGVIIWRITFYFHPNPPKINLNKYLIQLFFAHLVFGLFAGFTYRKLN